MKDTTEHDIKLTPVDKVTSKRRLLALIIIVKSYLAEENNTRIQPY